MTKNKSKTINSQRQDLFNILLVGSAVLINALFIYVIHTVNRFSALHQAIFLIINGVIALLLMILNLTTIKQLIKPAKRTVNAILVINLILLLVGGLFSFYLVQINSSINKIVAKGDTKESLSLSVVVYHGTGKRYSEMDDLAKKTVGVVANSVSSEIYNSSTEELEKHNLDVTFKEYNGYSDILIALYRDEIDAGVLPENYLYMFEGGEEDNSQEFLEKTEALYTYKRTITVEETSASDVDITKDPFTVLVIGMDESHSDVVMLATFNPQAMDVTYTSVARDSFIPKCGGAEDKLGHSRNISRNCTIQTIENLMNIKIDFYFETNFKGVVDMVDAVGTLEIVSPIAFDGQNSSYERGHYTVHIFKGLDNMSGEQVLAFARERKLMPGGDYQRQLNQQQVITAFINKLISLRDINKAVAVLNAAGENVRTNFTVEQMTQLFNMFMTKVERAPLKDTNLLKIVGTRVVGYPSWQYYEDIEQALWIYRLYNGSITENRNLILDNTDLKNTVITAPKRMNFSVNGYYDKVLYYQEEFSEQQYHSPMPDLVKDFTGWKLSDLKDWANARGITLNITQVHDNDQGFDANIGKNIVLSQDVRANRMVKKISSIGIRVNVPLPRVPDFAAMTRSEITSKSADYWKQEYDFELKTAYIKSHIKNEAGNWVENKEYVKEQAGKLKSQSVASGTLVDESISSVTLTYYDYPYYTTLSSIPKASLDQVREWVKNNMEPYGGQLAEVVVVETDDLTKVGTLELYNYNTTSTEPLKANGILGVRRYDEKKYTIPTLVGMKKTDFDAYLGGFEITGSGTETDNCTGQDVTILEVTGLTPAEVLTKAQIKTRAVSYKYCKLTTGSTGGGETAPGTGSGDTGGTAG